MIQQLIKLSLLFVIILDPISNLPLFVSVLKPFPAKKQKKLILRKMIFVLILMLLVFFFGIAFFNAINISMPTLKVSGGIMLLIIGIQMIFAKPASNIASSKDPFIVPLAIPAILTICFYSGNIDYNQLIVLASILIAWCITLPILLLSTPIKNFLKDNGLVAIERLFGFLVCILATEMILHGFFEALK